MTSGSRFVIPQAMSRLWPITTPGMPAKVNPLTSKGHSSFTVLQCSPIWCQMPGMVTFRCGSLASSGLPETVCSPETAQLFDPMPSPRPSRSGIASTPRCTASSAFRAAGAKAGPACASAARFGVRVDDRGVPLVGVAGIELVDLLRGAVDREPGASDLLVHVAAEVPRHRLEPGERVDRGPLLRLVVETGQPEDGVLHRQLGGRAPLQVGVHPVAVGVQVGTRGGREQLVLAGGHSPPAHRADVQVGLDRALAEQLAEPTGSGMAAEVHLEEPVLRLDEPLGAEEVVRSVRVDLRDPVLGRGAPRPCRRDLAAAGSRRPAGAGAAPPPPRRPGSRPVRAPPPRRRTPTAGPIPASRSSVSWQSRHALCRSIGSRRPRVPTPRPA